MSSKIVIACEIFPPDVGGPATFAPRLINELKSDGWQVEVVTYADTKVNTNDGVVRVMRRWPLPLRYFIYFVQLFKLSKDAKVIFCQGPMAAGLPGVIVGWLRNIKVVCKVVGDTAWERAKNRNLTKLTMDEFQVYNHQGKIFLYSFIRSWVTKRCVMVITPSQYLKKIVIGWGCKTDKVRVIYNSFQKKQLAEISKQHAKEKLNLSGWVLFSAARLTVWKGFTKLIESVNSLQQELPQLKLVIAGDGPERENLTNSINKYNLKDKVILAGQLNADQMVEYFQAVDGFILNSGYEGLSHVLLEALSFGLPTAASNVGGNPEVIMANKTGVLFDYNELESINSAVRELVTVNNSSSWKIEADKLLNNQFAYTTMMSGYKQTLKQICEF